MRNPIVVALCLVVLLIIGAVYALNSVTVTTVEKINGRTAEQFFLETSNPNISRVSDKKLRDEYQYVIRHYRHIDTKQYREDFPNDIILQSFSGGEFSYLIISKKLPSPKYIKKWTWKK